MTITFLDVLWPFHRSPGSQNSLIWVFKTTVAFRSEQVTRSFKPARAG